ncbi:hypothetical protein RclHR1_26390001 [Rhizophagus clarus]|uniref:Uncharacterized protein n=1 Tax=Rhizophagus clarus TaxID=94130 RepID=A0A2Z6R0E2_9GLOM|nr:hypothetical protein RclHR1_26390001 [Rhizophagus clarus]
MVIPDEVPPLLAALLPRNPRSKYSIYSDSIKWIVFLSKISSRNSQNVARRGGGLPNTNSRRAQRHNKRNNNNNSDNSSSDGEGAAQQKRTRTLSANTMDEDFVTDTAADVGVDGLSSPPKENNTVSPSFSSPPNSAAASSAPPTTRLIASTRLCMQEQRLLHPP